MDAGVITEEPDSENESFEQDRSIELMQCESVQQTRGEIKEVPARERISMAKFDDATFAIVSENPNIITVSVAESFKTEGEISSMKQLIAGENQMHDPALILPTQLEIYTKENQSFNNDNLIDEENTESFECRKNCGKIFQTLTARALHETHDHKNKYRKIKCNFCNETFESFFDLTRHMPQHRKASYICSLCSKCCNSYLDLQNHWKASKGCSGEGEETSKAQQNISLKNTSIPLITSVQKNALSQDMKHCDLEPSNQAPNNLSLSNSLTFRPTPLSFSEEVKAFSAKYQLKTVAKKRTSALNYKPKIHEKKRRGSDVVREENYAIPTSVNNFAYPIPDITIKKEPIDNEEMINNLDTEILNEIQIKNEPYDDYEYNKYITDDKKAQANQFSLQTEVERNPFYKMLGANSKNIKTECENDDVSRETMEVSEPNPSEQLQLPKFLLNQANLMKMKNIKIFKLSPNAKIVKLTSESTKQIEKNKQNNKLIVPSLPDTFVPFKTPQLSSISPKEPEQATAKIIKSDYIKNENLPDSLDKKYSFEKIDIYSAENKKDIATKKRNEINRLPNWILRFMEQQPQQKQFIEQYKNQFISEAEEISSCSNDLGVNPPEFIPPTTTASAIPQLPQSFFLKVSDFSDKQLMIARREHNDYNYAWLCPKCHREYTQKHAFVSHLVGAHKVTTEELKDLTVEVKPFRDVTTVKPEQNLSSTQKRPENKNVAVNCLKKIAFNCLKCNQIFSTNRHYNDHINSDCGRESSYKCTECYKSFFNKSSLNCHKTIHTGELPYKCNYCDKYFRTRGQVRVHHRLHTGEKPFRCQVCFQTFKHRETLISHLSRHTGIKRYRCNGCNKHFSAISGLRAHHKHRSNTCGLVELDTRAVGPRIRVVGGKIFIESQTNLPKGNLQVLTDIQNTFKNTKE